MGILLYEVDPWEVSRWPSAGVTV